VGEVDQPDVTVKVNDGVTNSCRANVALMVKLETPAIVGVSEMLALPS
jgi:hypothetical protein